MMLFPGWYLTNTPSWAFYSVHADLSAKCLALHDGTSVVSVMMHDSLSCRSTRGMVGPGALSTTA
eukprot:10571827-Prorocentrum_lima.AAC.1